MTALLRLRPMLFPGGAEPRSPWRQQAPFLSPGGAKMKQAPLVLTALAVLMAGNVAISVACDQSKKTKTSAAAAGVSASATGDHAGCPYSGAAVTISSSACPHAS